MISLSFPQCFQRTQYQFVPVIVTLVTMIMIVLLLQSLTVCSSGGSSRLIQFVHNCSSCWVHLKHHSACLCLSAVAAFSLHIPCTILLVHVFGFAGGGYAVVVMRTAHFAFTVCKSLLILTHVSVPMQCPTGVERF